jgi:hypothetical protein
MALVQWSVGFVGRFRAVDSSTNYLDLCVEISAGGTNCLQNRFGDAIMALLLRIARASSKLDGIGLLSGKNSVILLAAGMLSLSGCDPVRTTSQRITIAVENDRGLPVPDAKVRIKESWESWQSWTPGGFKEGERAFYRERWESDFVPWHEGLSDAQGKVVLEMVVCALDWTKGNEAPAKRDRVSNREYIVKVQTKDAEDELLAVMKPGTISKGKRYTVRIEAIEKPRYIGGFKRHSRKACLFPSIRASASWRACPGAILAVRLVGVSPNHTFSDARIKPPLGITVLS